MARGKFQKKRKFAPLVWILLVLIILGSTTGGVAAYLSASADPVTHTLTVASDPTATVSKSADGTKCTVSVSAPGYPVYLRVAVAVNAVNSGKLVANQPGGFSGLGSEWKTIGNYYYYLNTITGDKSFEINTEAGYDLSVAAQVIQAVGTTDDGNVDAVIDAWGARP